MKKIRLSTLMAVTAFLAAPALAQNTESNSPIAKLLNTQSEDDFLHDFALLSSEQKDEVRTLFTTELPSWTALAAAPKAFFENASEGNRAELRQSLVDWLRQKPTENSFERLRFVTLSEHPVQSKIKFEKGACPVARAESAQSPSGFMCGLRAKFGAWACPQPAPAKSVVAPGEACDYNLNVGVAVDLLGEKGIFEETLFEGRRSEFLGSFAVNGRWLQLRRKLWLSLERLYTKLPAYRENLASRVRIAELINTEVDRPAFDRKKDLLAQFAKAQLSSDPRRLASLVEELKSDAAPLKTAQPARPVVAAVSARNASFSELATDYGSRTFDLLYTVFTTLERNSASWDARSQRMQLAWKRFRKDSAASEILSQFEQRVQSLPPESLDVEWQAKEYVQELRRVGYFRKPLFQREQKSIRTLDTLMSWLRRETKKTLPLSEDERILFESLEFQQKVVSSLRTRLLQNSSAGLN